MDNFTPGQRVYHIRRGCWATYDRPGVDLGLTSDTSIVQFDAALDSAPVATARLLPEGHPDIPVADA